MLVFPRHVKSRAAILIDGPSTQIGAETINNQPDSCNPCHCRTNHGWRLHGLRHGDCTNHPGVCHLPIPVLLPHVLHLLCNYWCHFLPWPSCQEHSEHSSKLQSIVIRMHTVLRTDRSSSIVIIVLAICHSLVIFGIQGMEGPAIWFLGRAAIRRKYGWWTGTAASWLWLGLLQWQ